MAIRSSFRKSFSSAFRSPISGGGEPVPTTRFAPYFEGASQYLSPVTREYAGDFYIEFELESTLTSADWAVCDSSSFAAAGGQALIYVDNPDGLQILIPYANGNFYRYYFGGQTEICNGERNSVKLERVGATMTCYINGSVFSTVENTVAETVRVPTTMFGGVSRFFSGTLFKLDLNGTIFPLTESFDNYPILQSSNTSETIEAKNFSSSNVVETSA